MSAPGGQADRSSKLPSPVVPSQPAPPLASREATANLLERIGKAYRRSGDDRRARAYTRAASAVLSRADFEDLSSSGRLRAIDGVGPSIAKTISDFLASGEPPTWLQEISAEGAAGGDGGPESGQRDLATLLREAPDLPFGAMPDLHCHSTWSDGTLEIAEIVEVARALGASSIGISDHSQRLHIAHGLSVDRVHEQWNEIERIQRESPDFRILKGIECDILSNGELDYPDEVLGGFDYVIGSAHSALRLPKREQTARLLAAIENPYLTLIGHPTNRVLGRRAASELDFDVLFEAARKRGVAFEVNGSAGRMDLDVPLARRALAAGAKLSIGSDGHSVSEMLGIRTARRIAMEAGATPRDLVNAAVLARAKKRTRGPYRRPSAAGAARSPKGGRGALGTRGAHARRG
ncbi:MAG: PHP domain-containing protein [Thermoplasmatota archaeon]